MLVFPRNFLVSHSHPLKVEAKGSIYLPIRAQDKSGFELSYFHETIFFFRADLRESERGFKWAALHFDGGPSGVRVQTGVGLRGVG